MPEHSRTPQRYRGGELVIVIDCADLDRSADFWTETLGYLREGSAGKIYQTLVPADGRGCEILLQRVPDRKSAKTRLHLDLRTTDLASEVERVRNVGAALVAEQPITEAGWSWHVLVDPDGNEFCILQPPSDYWQS
jgi:predicted enzyme related to lactoylglutathione lyase